MKKKRLIYLGTFALLLAVEVLIALFVRDAFVRPFVGDVLVVILLVLLCRVFIPEGVRLLPLYVFLFACCVELLQFADPVRLLGLEGCPFLRIALGSTFDPLDLLAYAIGGLIAFLGERLISKRRK